MENKESVETLITSFYKPKLPSFSKRIGAFILDFICIIIILVGLCLLFSVLFGYDQTNEALDLKYIEYGIKYYDEENNLLITKGTDEELALLWNLFDQDAEAVHLWERIVDLSLIIPILSLTLSMLIFEFLIPLIMKHGRSIGRYVFKIGLITNEEIEVKGIHLFIRFLFGKLIINSLIPLICLLLVYLNLANFLSVMILFCILIINLAFIIFSKNHIGISDRLAKVYPCEMEGQTFFNSVEELNKKKQEEMKRYNRKKVY